MIAAEEKISIIVPVYNVEKYLSTALTSCIQQTLRDIEIICVDDGSTDRSSEILEAFQKIDSRISVIHQKNGGLSSARNAGIRAAHGEWIIFLDSDDILAENTCARVFIENREGPSDIIVYGADTFPEYPRPDEWLKTVLWVPTRRYDGFSPEVLFHTSGSIPFVWRQAYRRSFLIENDLFFDEDILFGEDTVFQLEAFPKAEHFAFISDVLYHYRWSRPGSLMAEAQKDLDTKIEKHLYFMDRICAYWQAQNWFELYGREFCGWMLEFIVPDTQSAEVKRASEHLTVLREIMERYALLPYAQKLKGTQRFYLRKVLSA